MGRMLSVDVLRRYGACHDGREQFVSVFGEDDVEMVATPEMAEKIRQMDVEWGAEKLLLHGGYYAWEAAITPTNDIYSTTMNELHDKYYHEYDAWSVTREGDKPVRNDAKLKALSVEFDTFCALEFLKLYEKMGVGAPVETEAKTEAPGQSVREELTELVNDPDQPHGDSVTPPMVAVTEEEAIQVDLMRRGHIVPVEDWMF